MLPLNPAQELLLKAALLPKELAWIAWKAWLAMVDWQHSDLDAGSYAILPLIYKNLPEDDKSPADSWQMGRLRGIYRRSWVINETVLRTLEQALKTLKAENTSVLLPDGAALALRFFEHHACRPLTHQTVWVPLNQALAAVGTLLASDWQLASQLPIPVAKIRNLVRRIWPLRHKNGTLLLICGRFWSGREQALWTAAQPLLMGMNPVLTLNPTEQLLEISRQASRAQPVMRLPFWVDAAQVIRSAGPDLDWHRMGDQPKVLGLLKLLAAISDDYSNPGRKR